MIAAAARYATRLAVAHLGGNRPILLRRRSVVVAQKKGRATRELLLLDSAGAASTSLRLGGEALDGVLAAGSVLRLRGASYTLTATARLAGGSASVSISPGLALSLPAGEAVEIAEPAAEITVRALRRNVPAVDAEGGTTLSGAVYLVSASELAFEVDNTWQVVDGDVVIRVSRATPVLAGGQLIRWDIECGAAA